MRLVPSPALRRVLATLSALHRLDDIERSEYAPTSHTLTGDRVRQWERELGSPLPTDVLLVEALHIPIVERALGRIDGSAAAHPAHADDDTWWPFWYGDPWAMTETSRDRTYQQAIDLCVAIRKESPMPADPDVMIAITDEDGRELKLSAFLLERIRSRFIPPEALEEDLDTHETERRESLWKEASESPAADADVDRDYAASIVDEAARPGSTKRVEHVKFGKGTILSAADGVVEVQFDSGEKKKLKRSFVRDL